MREMISEQQWTFYQKNGYLVVENILSKQRLEILHEALEKRYRLEGNKAGEEGSNIQGVRRLCNLIAKDRAFEKLAIEPIALEMAKRAIGDDMRWQAMNFHDPIPSDPRPHQAIHADRSFFKNCTAYFNVVWALDDMTEQNGATRLVPGSHNQPWPKDVLTDAKETVEGEIYATCPAGTAIFLHGDVWHGGRANHSTSPRRVIHLGYCSPNTAPQYEIANSLTPEVRQRLGAHCTLIPNTLASFNQEEQ
jgi:ectoine hydroxylase-related dioxygenase (phytanoyl-CoA dioxygenase family)